MGIGLALVRNLVELHGGSITAESDGLGRGSRFVIRFPDEWNGKLVITGPPGVRGQYANDFIIGDFVLEKGYAYAATDKGNSGNRFYSGGVTQAASVADWHRCVEQLTVAAKEAARN